eukprot:gene2805-3487_t
MRLYSTFYPNPYQENDTYYKVLYTLYFIFGAGLVIYIFYYSYSDVVLNQLIYSESVDDLRGNEDVVEVFGKDFIARGMGSRTSAGKYSYENKADKIIMNYLIEGKGNRKGTVEVVAKRLKTDYRFSFTLQSLKVRYEDDYEIVVYDKEPKKQNSSDEFGDDEEEEKGFHEDNNEELSSSTSSLSSSDKYIDEDKEIQDAISRYQDEGGGEYHKYKEEEDEEGQEEFKIRSPFKRYLKRRHSLPPQPPLPSSTSPTTNTSTSNINYQSQVLPSLKSPIPPSTFPPNYVQPNPGAPKLKIVQFRDQVSNANKRSSRLLAGSHRIERGQQEMMRDRDFISSTVKPEFVIQESSQEPIQLEEMTEEEKNRRFFISGVLIKDALYYRDPNHLLFTDRLKWYNIYYHWASRFFMLFLNVGILALAYFEYPALHRAPHYVTESIELAIVLILFAELGFKRYVYGKPSLQNPWNWIKLICLTINIIDIIVAYILQFNDITDTARVSRIVRIYYLIDYDKLTRDLFIQVIYTFAHMLPVAVVLFSYIFLSSVMFSIIFSNGTTSDPNYFNSTLTSFLNMMVLITTANFPDVMLPAYYKSHYLAIFFILYLGFGLYLGLNFIIAFVYHAFRRAVLNETKKNYRLRRIALLAAFIILDHDRTGVIRLDQWESLYKMLKPKSTEHEASAAFDLIDTDANGYLNVKEFFAMCDVFVLERKKVQLLAQKRLLETKRKKPQHHHHHHPHLHHHSPPHRPRGQPIPPEQFQPHRSIIDSFDSINNNNISSPQSSSNLRTSQYSSTPSSTRTTTTTTTTTPINNGNNENEEENINSLRESREAPLTPPPSPRNSTDSTSNRYHLPTIPEDSSFNNTPTTTTPITTTTTSTTTPATNINTDNNENQLNLNINNSDHISSSPHDNRDKYSESFKKPILKIQQSIRPKLKTIHTFLKSGKLKKVTKHWTFELVVSLLLYFNASIITYVMVTLKALSHMTIKKPWIMFNVVIVTTSFLGKFIIEYGLMNIGDKLLLLRLACMFRFIRIFRLLASTRRMRHFVQSLFQIFFIFINFAGIIFLLYYFFAVIGIWAYDGVFYRGNPKLVGTAYDAQDYYGFANFNSFSAAMMTLLHLMVVNNWLVTFFAAIDATSAWSILFFCPFYYIAVVCTMNMVIAFLIESVNFTQNFTHKHKHGKIFGFTFKKKKKPPPPPPPSKPLRDESNKSSPTSSKKQQQQQQWKRCTSPEERREFETSINMKYLEGSRGHHHQIQQESTHSPATVTPAPTRHERPQDYLIEHLEALKKHKEAEHHPDQEPQLTDSQGGALSVRSGHSRKSVLSDSSTVASALKRTSDSLPLDIQSDASKHSLEDVTDHTSNISNQEDYSNLNASISDTQSTTMNDEDETDLEKVSISSKDHHLLQPSKKPSGGQMMEPRFIEEKMFGKELMDLSHEDVDFSEFMEGNVLNVTHPSQSRSTSRAPSRRNSFSESNE